MVVFENSKKFLVCYASQKGNAHAIAEDLFSQCIEHISDGYLSCLSEIKSVYQLNQYSCTVFIGSTTGDGDPPDTALHFMRELKKQINAGEKLPWLNYTILGLGDSNYTNFCNFGKTLDNYLKSLGSKCFYDCGWADDGTGLEEVVEPWIDDVIPTLETFLASQPSPEEKETEKMQNRRAAVDDESSMMEILPADSKISQNFEKMRKDLCGLFPDFKLSSFKEQQESAVKKLIFPPDTKLTLPSVPLSYLNLSYSDNHQSDVTEKINSVLTSELINGVITKCRKLSNDSALRKTLEVSLRIGSDVGYTYEPGDSFNIIIQNNHQEVDCILHLLRVIDKANYYSNLSIDSNTEKKSAALPKHIPSQSSLRFIFTNCVDFRAIPKKLFLRSLIEFTQDDLEKRRLMELVSKEGADDYNRVFREGGLTFMDLLLIFSSCIPSISLVLEHLPKLLPRSYSITSSPLVDSGVISFAFNVIEIPRAMSVTFTRKGICTGWLDELTKDTQEENEEPIERAIDRLQLSDGLYLHQLQISFRGNANFRLPKDINIPIIMIGPGTGVAPFIGFMKHRQFPVKNSPDFADIGFSWLFFGCRHRDKDFLYKRELESFVASGILSKLSVSFSREGTDGPKYVQDNIRDNSESLVDLIDKKGAFIYVCGDAKNMSRNVFDVFIEILRTNLILSELEARKYLAQMQLNGRYLQDVWT